MTNRSHEIAPGPAGETRRIRLWGIVQGVGMRPLVTRLARSLNLTGQVRNTDGLLEIEIAGHPDQLDRFSDRLHAEKPESAVYIRETTERMDWAGGMETRPGFVILDSTVSSQLELAFPSPDLAICPACEQELAEAGNRRFRHAFNSCMHCGPRYSILQTLPYDRITTTMADYPLCPACQAEYTDDADRRFHAQTIACPDCGPQLVWQGRPDAAGAQAGDHPLAMAVQAIQSGQVIAVKATGGYHLACRADQEQAVQACRAIKQRDRKPFAVLFASLEMLADYASYSEAEADLLCSQARPIVLLDDLKSSTLARAVAMQSPCLGAMLPATPIQKLLAEACGPLVMTSANRSDDLLLYRDDDLGDFVRQAEDIAGVLTFRRDILQGLDDSVVRWQGRCQFIRRARGYVPLAVDLGQLHNAITAGDPLILALGGDLKATAAWSKSGFAWLTQPAGDLASLQVQAAWQENLDHLQHVLGWPTGSAPDLICQDQHPGYFSQVLFKDRWPEVPRLSIQHHHAHIASVLAEHQLQEPVLGIAFDGTGYGADGTIWGGEFLLCTGPQYQRLAHFKPTFLPGGDTAMRDAWRSLAGYLEASGLPNPAANPAQDPAVDRARSERLTLVRQALRTGINGLANSSVGRLFDAVCALLELSDVNHFEGECGSLLEAQAVLAEQQGWSVWPLSFRIEQPDRDSLVIDPAPVLADLLNALGAGSQADLAGPGSADNARRADRSDRIARLALGFHQALCDATLAVCQQLAQTTGCRTIAVSGGVFQNAVLVRRLDRALTEAGFRVYWNEKVPPHDGGICLGQAWLGRQLVKKGSS